MVRLGMFRRNVPETLKGTMKLSNTYDSFVDSCQRTNNCVFREFNQAIE